MAWLRLFLALAAWNGAAAPLPRACGAAASGTARLRLSLALAVRLLSGRCGCAFPSRWLCGRRRRGASPSRGRCGGGPDGAAAPLSRTCGAADGAAAPLSRAGGMGRPDRELKDRADNCKGCPTVFHRPPNSKTIGDGNPEGFKTGGRVCTLCGSKEVSTMCYGCKRVLCFGKDRSKK